MHWGVRRAAPTRTDLVNPDFDLVHPVSTHDDISVLPPVLLGADALWSKPSIAISLPPTGMAVSLGGVG